jgi:hypothetical protein
MNLSMIIKSAITLSLVATGVVIITPRAEAGCYYTGKTIRGHREMKCDGGPSRCKPRGPIIYIKGIPYRKTTCR